MKNLRKNLRKVGSASAAALAFGLLAACTAAQRPVPVTPASSPAAPEGVNPFAGARFYVNPDYARMIDGAAARAPADGAPLLKKLAALPTAIWLSSIADLSGMQAQLDDALKQQTTSGQPVVPLFVVYDMPGRDCNAEASAGELPISEACEARYQREYIDVIAAQLRAHPQVRVALIIEPDSLANLVTNLETPKCTAAEGIYRRGVAYAVSKLSLPNAFLYLDAAHGGWLGWPRNLVKAMTLYRDVLAMAGGPGRIRGFALNVSNYDPVHVETTIPRDPATAPIDELGYVGDLVRGLATVGIAGKGFLVDTARNGRPGVRTSPGNWCNVKGAGLGERPRAEPAPHVDAYVFVKPPGESDGVADPKAPRFDQNCASDDAAPGAPQAGKLFEPYLMDLVKNATPPL